MDSQQQRQQRQCCIPDDFRCPISLELMSDPVTLTSGHTFDRRSIQRWLDSGNRTCPVTNLPLPPHPTLIPNHALRSLISTFAPPPPPNSHLSHPLPLSFPSTPQSLTLIRTMAQKDPSFRRRFADSDAVPVLLRHVSSHDYPELRELALRVLLDVSLDGDDVKVGLVAGGAVDHLAAALHQPSASCRTLAATTITSLAVADVNKCTIGAHPSALAGLMAALRGVGRERREAATALYVICTFPGNRKRVVRLGAVPALVDLAAAGVERAVEVLALLGKCEEGRAAMRRVEGFVGVMSGVVRKGCGRGLESGLMVLNFVCGDSEEMRRMVMEEGILEACMGLAVEEEGSIGRNAATLMRTLQR